MKEHNSKIVRDKVNAAVNDPKDTMGGMEDWLAMNLSSAVRCELQPVKDTISKLEGQVHYVDNEKINMADMLGESKHKHRE